MFMLRLACLICVVAVSTVVVNSAILLGAPSGEVAALGNRTYGAEFTVGSLDLSVTDLGAFDLGEDGLNESHQVGLWDSSNTLLGSVTVPAGTGATLIGEYRYVSLALPVALSANTTYWIGALFDNQGTTDDIGIQGSASVDPAIASANLQRRSITLNTFERPTDPSGVNGWAANMQFTAVPEPQSYAALFGIALLAFASYRKLRSGRTH